MKEIPFLPWILMCPSRQDLPRYGELFLLMTLQDQIYFIVLPSRSHAADSPYLEAFKKQGMEVLLCYNSVDEFIFTNLGTFDKK